MVSNTLPALHRWCGSLLGLFDLLSHAADSEWMFAFLCTRVCCWFSPFYLINSAISNHTWPWSRHASTVHKSFCPPQDWFLSQLKLNVMSSHVLRYFTSQIISTEEDSVNQVFCSQCVWTTTTKIKTVGVSGPSTYVYKYICMSIYICDVEHNINIYSTSRTTWIENKVQYKLQHSPLGGLMSLSNEE